MWAKVILLVDGHGNAVVMLLTLLRDLARIAIYGRYHMGDVCFGLWFSGSRFIDVRPCLFLLLDLRPRVFVTPLPHCQ